MEPQRRRSGLGLLAVALPIVALNLIAAMPVGAVAPCRADTAQTTVAENHHARLFTWLAPYPASGSGRVVWLQACSKASGRTFWLASWENGFDFYEHFDAARLSGRFVAWYAEGQDSCRYGCPPGGGGVLRSLKTLDLRSGEQASVTLTAPPAGMVLTLGRDGALAWPVWLPGNQVVIRVADAGGEREVASGPIHPESLRLFANGLLEWREDGVARSVRLQPRPPDTIAPRLSGLAVPRRIGYRLSEAAAVRFTIARHRARRSVPLPGSLVQYGLKGRNALSFRGRLPRGSLRPGRYVLTAQATDYAGHRSLPQRVAFTIAAG